MAPPPINAKAETSPRCPYCRRDDCYVPVTDDWPAWAREAYERGGYEHAPTCALGQAKDGPGVRQAIRDLQKKALELEL